MAITSTHLSDTSGAGLASFTVNPTAIGDCVAVYFVVGTLGATARIGSLSSSGCQWVIVPGSQQDGAGNNYCMALGTVFATGSQAVTITYVGTIGSVTVEAQTTELSDGAARTWGVSVVGALKTNTASTTATYPTITSALSLSNQAYFGGVSTGGGAVTGTVGGFTQTVDTTGNGNGWLFGTVASNTAATPAITSGITPSSTSEAMGMIVCANNVVRPGRFVRQAVAWAGVR